MTAILDKIREHAQPQKVRRLEVPEWALDDSGPLVITYTMITLEDLATVTELDGDAWPKRASRIIALKAMDATGQRMFNTADASIIRETAAPEVVGRIATHMLARVSVEQAEKN